MTHPQILWEGQSTSSNHISPTLFLKNMLFTKLKYWLSIFNSFTGTITRHQNEHETPKYNFQFDQTPKRAFNRQNLQQNYCKPSWLLPVILTQSLTLEPVLFCCVATLLPSSWELCGRGEPQRHMPARCWPEWEQRHRRFAACGDRKSSALPFKSGFKSGVMLAGAPAVGEKKMLRS